MNKSYREELFNLIVSEPSVETLREKLENYHYSDIADALEQTGREQRLRVYSTLGTDVTAEIFSFYENVEYYIGELPSEYVADLLECMHSADAVNLLNELDDSEKDALIELMEQDARETIERIESYSEDEVGSYITDNYISIPSSSTVKGAMSRMIKEAGEHDNIFTLYITDERGRYVGAVSLKDLISARGNDDFTRLIRTSYPHFYDDELVRDCIEKLKDYAEASIPVLNRNREIVGVITADNVIDLTEDEFEEDYAKFGGLTEEEQTDEPVRFSIKKRMPWLVTLLFLGLIVSSVIGAFESVISALPVVVFFQTMILGMAGNAGTQSLAVTIRNLSGGNSDNGKAQRKGLLKELRIGFINGILIGLISFLVVTFYLAVSKQEIIAGGGYVFKDVLTIGGVIGISMLISITLASFIGTAFPLLLSKLHFDPAVASGPFITTLNDISAIFVYYGLTFLLFSVILA